jgi:hypothetical protein
MHEDSPLLQAIELYAVLTGVKVPEKEEDRYGLTNFHKLGVESQYDSIKEALELDPSEVTASLMLSYYTRDMLADQKLSMSDLMKDPEGYIKKLEAPKRLLAIVNSDDVVAERDRFIEGLAKALEHYGAGEREDLKVALTEYDRIAFLRRDALRCVERLRLNQFLRGDPEPDSYKPLHHPKVHQWWNVNSLLSGAMGMPSGISMNLIRDKDAYQSYFCFCVRNGGNLFILNDAPEFTHPMQGQMTRRPDRALGERSAKAWFPYDLVVEWDEEAEQYFIKRTDKTGIAVYQQEYKPLDPIAKLGVNETIWAVMMLDLIAKKFWKQNIQLPELSYTGEMIKVTDALISKAETANLPVAGYTPLSMPKLELSDVLSDAPHKKHFGRQYHNPNRWLEERFKDKINPAILNVVDQGGSVVLLPGTTVPDTFGERKKGKKKVGEIIEGGLTRITPSQWNLLSSFDQRELTTLAVMDSTKFGTKEELEADRTWIARYNLATNITVLAAAEYKAREKEVKDWVKARLLANLPNILPYAINERIWVDEGFHATFDNTAASGEKRAVRLPDADKKWIFDKSSRQYRTFMVRHDLKADRQSRRRGRYFTPGFDDYNGLNLGDYGWEKCALNGAKASYRVTFYPANARQLAFLCGCKVEDLPDVLQHWDLNEPYTGNSILDRIDPLVWHCDDPWHEKLKLKAFLFLSKSALNEIKKKNPVAPFPDLPEVMKNANWEPGWMVDPEPGEKPEEGATKRLRGEDPEENDEE